MARILAIDFGKKRCGLAVTDSMQLIANRLTTVESPRIISFLKDYFQKEEVECVVIGLPKDLRNNDTDATALVLAFAEQFKKNFPTIPQHFADERYTSKMASKTLVDVGLKKKDRQQKELLDSVSATIILQSFLEQREFLKDR